MAIITLNKGANTLAGYFGSGATASAFNDALEDGGSIVLNAAMMRHYIGSMGNAADADNDALTDILYAILRRVEDTYNGVVGTMTGTNNTAPTVVNGTKPTNFSISRVETTDKAIFTVAIPLAKTTTVEGGSL